MFRFTDEERDAFEALEGKIPHFQATLKGVVMAGIKYIVNLIQEVRVCIIIFATFSYLLLSLENLESKAVKMPRTASSLSSIKSSSQIQKRTLLPKDSVV